MASEDRHITRIEKTEALFRTNGDHGQSAILTDQSEEWVYYNDDKTLLYYAAAQKTWDGAAWAYVNNDFGQVTLHDDLLVEEYIKRAAGTDDLIRFENDKITIQAGGAVAAVFEDTLINFLLPTQIGDAGTPSALSILQVQKDQNAGTELRIMNDTAGTDAYAGLKVWANSASGLLAAYDDGFTTVTEFTDKIVLSSGTVAIAIVATAASGVIQFYVDGSASTDKMFTINQSGLVPGNAATIHAVAQNAAPTTTTDGALWLDLDASANGDLMMYSGAGWRKIISLP